MPPHDFPKHQVPSLQELGARLLDSRKQGTTSEAFARELLVGFFDTCMHSGLDRVLGDLAEVHTPIDIKDRFALAEHPGLLASLGAQVDAIALDGGSPRATKPAQIANAVVAALGLTLVDDPDRTIMLDHTVRTDVVAALASVVNAELAVPAIREAIIMKARAKCPPLHLAAFEKVVAQLDETGMRMIKQPKVPLDASQAIQQGLVDARNAVFDRMGRAAIDRAKAKIEGANPEAASRIDLPVSLKLTPRDVAILRVCDPRVPKVPALVVESLLTTLSAMARLAWRGLERPVRPYAASQTFAVGELIEHPKFGRGNVTSTMAQRIDVEFADGKHTLVHVPAKK